MTLCIAAISDNDIVTVSDLMLSTPYMSMEAMTAKVWPMGPRAGWLHMFAGSPSVRRRVIDHIDSALETGGDETTEAVRRAVEAACRDVLREKIEADVLGVYGLDRETFLRNGRAYFGAEEFSRILSKMQAVSLETEFLVGGWEHHPDGSMPRLFSVQDGQQAEHHDALGFHAIGSGWVRALGALYGTFERHAPTAEVIYQLCEAKFLGESASGVGKLTVVMCLSRDGECRMMEPPEVEGLRKIVEARKPQIPSAATELITQSLGKVEVGGQKKDAK